MTVRSGRAEETAGRVLDAALVEYAAVPFDLVRLDAVATGAGVTVQTVPRRFGSEGGLVVALAERELGRIAASRAAGLAAPPAVLLHAAGRALRDVRRPDHQDVRGRGPGRGARRGRPAGS